MDSGSICIMSGHIPSKLVPFPIFFILSFTSSITISLSSLSTYLVCSTRLIVSRVGFVMVLED